MGRLILQSSENGLAGSLPEPARRRRDERAMPYVVVGRMTTSAVSSGPAIA